MELNSWLSQPPKYTTFRINKLKVFDLKHFETFLEHQRVQINSKEVPNFYCLTPDCVVIEQWPVDVQPKNSNSEVIVDALCAAAVLRGAHVFAPGVMGLSTGCNINDEVDIYGDLEGRCKKGLKVVYTGKKQFVGKGHLKMLRHELFKDGPPSGIAVEVILPASRLPVINESVYPKGTLVLQNLPSMVCGWVVNAHPNELILDMCAAPGNKTTHLAEMSNDQAIIVAIDKTPKKVAKIKENCINHGVTCVRAYVFDSTKCHLEDGNSFDEGPPYNSNTFDKVLLDGPCSGLGQRPQLINKMTPKKLQSYKFVQRKLFDAAVKVLKVGGLLIYSTCTVTEDENEVMVAWVLDKFPCLQLVMAAPLLGGPGMASPSLSDSQRVMLQRFGPEEDHLRIVNHPIYKDTIGFFIAKFTKAELS